MIDSVKIAPDILPHTYISLNCMFEIPSSVICSALETFLITIRYLAMHNEIRLLIGDALTR